MLHILTWRHPPHLGCHVMKCSVVRGKTLLSQACLRLQGEAVDAKEQAVSLAARLEEATAAAVAAVAGGLDHTESASFQRVRRQFEAKFAGELAALEQALAFEKQARSPGPQLNSYALPCFTIDRQ